MVFDLGPGFLIGAWGLDCWADVRSNTEDLCRSLVKFEAKSFAAAGSRLVVAATAAASGDMVLEAGPGFFLGDLALDGCVIESSVIFESSEDCVIM